MARGKARLATSKEVYNAIRWDPRLDPAAFVIVYEERFSGQREVPLLEFSPEGEVPWHRVWAIRRGAETVWDRSARIDRLREVAQQAAAAPAPTSSTTTPELPARAQLDAEVETHRVEVLRFDASRECWRPAGELSTAASAPRQPGLLRVASLNVLNPALAPGLPHALRTQAIITLLERLDADVIALQEATPPFMATLLAQAWVCAHFYVCPLAPHTRERDHGQVLLSRLPMSNAVRLEGWRGKHLLLADLDRGGHNLSVAVVHLSSRLAKDAPALRAQQQRCLAEALEQRAQASLVLGDFNLEAEDELEPLLGRGWRDLWTTLRGEEAGLTFDPVHNSVAAATSRSGLSRRYDRLLWRDPSAALSPLDVRLFAQRALPASASSASSWGARELYPSDHYGVVALLRDANSLPAAVQAPPSYHSAVVLLPPESVWPPIQALRARHDRSFARWMPHINLLYGFISDAAFSQAEPLLVDVLQSLEPFGVELGSFGRFDHRGSSSLWLDPETLPDRALIELQALLERLFPQCDELSRRGQDGYRPHLTVGSFSKRARPELSRLLRELSRDWQPIEFEAGSIALISRRDDEPFVVRARIPLGARLGSKPAEAGPRPLLREPAPAQRSERDAALARIEALCQAAAPGSALLVSGSVRLGLELPESDLDLTWICPPGSTRAHAFTALEQLLEREPEAAGLTRAQGTGETLRVQLGSCDLDLQLAVAPPGAASSSPLAWTPSQREQLSSAGELAIKGLRDAEALERFGTHHGCWPLLQASIKLLKQWARARDLDVTALGFLGGISWSVLAASCLSARAPLPASLPAALGRVFTQLDAWDGHTPFVLGDTLDGWQAQRRDKLAVLSPALPRVNTARHVTASTAQVLVREWRRARELVEAIDAGRGSWSELLAPLEPPSGRRVCLRVHAESSAALHAARGWLRAKVLGLVLTLEQRCAAQLRPRSRSLPLPWEMCLVIESCPAEDSALRAVLDSFAASFPWTPDEASLQLQLLD